MTFEVDAAAYGRFMGRFSVPLAAQFADLMDVTAGQTALDVGCGTGALTDELVARLGVDRVSGVDPSRPFVAAVRERHPTIDVRLGTAEDMDFPDASFDRVLAALVVQFMSDPITGIVRMGRAARPDGVVGACVWDHGGGRGPLGLFWQVVREIDPQAPDESHQAGVAEGQLQSLFTTAGLRDVRSDALEVTVRHSSFDDWWQPFTLGVGPAGAHVNTLHDSGRARLEAALRDRLPVGAFTTTALAWVASGRPPLT